VTVSWFFMTSHLRPPPGMGLDESRTSRLVGDLASQVQDRVAWCFAGEAWLSRRFPRRSNVLLQLRVQDSTDVLVDPPRTKNIGGPKEVRCQLTIPAHWCREPGDGLLGLRMFTAVSKALTVIGTRYDLGPPPLRKPTAVAGKPPIYDLFTSRDFPPSAYGSAANEVQRLADHADPHQLVVSATGPFTERPDLRNDVLRALGNVEGQKVIAIPADKEVTIWTVRIPL
jgi:hypothetical protein